ncbi:hypothetical protein FA95DRAFT_1605106 [Auriscalpium vulgare]|uniref:Uncharacterized protein n=1 Tax=Auriscalpium vulgare TaxID=40419 RepID=A0ACB8RYD2_9AGAM|nr:hypothetical protein FA95DRAFT_1605106 [Auriscalpium vulgare]
MAHQVHPNVTLAPTAYVYILQAPSVPWWAGSQHSLSPGAPLFFAPAPAPVPAFAPAFVHQPALAYGHQPAPVPAFVHQSAPAFGHLPAPIFFHQPAPIFFHQPAPAFVPAFAPAPVANPAPVSPASTSAPEPAFPHSVPSYAAGARAPPLPAHIPSDAPPLAAPRPTPISATPAFLSGTVPPTALAFDTRDSPIMWGGGSPVTFAVVPPAHLPRTPPPTPTQSVVQTPVRASPVFEWGDDAPITPLAPAPIHARERERRRLCAGSCASPIPSPMVKCRLPPMSPFGGECASVRPEEAVAV